MTPFLRVYTGFRSPRLGLALPAGSKRSWDGRIMPSIFPAELSLGSCAGKAQLHQGPLGSAGDPLDSSSVHPCRSCYRIGPLIPNEDMEPTHSSLFSSSLRCTKTSMTSRISLSLPLFALTFLTRHSQWDNAR